MRPLTIATMTRIGRLLPTGTGGFNNRDLKEALTDLNANEIELPEPIKFKVLPQISIPGLIMPGTEASAKAAVKRKKFTRLEGLPCLGSCMHNGRGSAYDG